MPSEEHISGLFHPALAHAGPLVYLLDSSPIPSYSPQPFSGFKSPGDLSRVHVSSCQVPRPALTNPAGSNEATTLRCRGAAAARAQLRLVRSPGRIRPQRLLSSAGGGRPLSEGSWDSLLLEVGAERVASSDLGIAGAKKAAVKCFRVKTSELRWGVQAERRLRRSLSSSRSVETAEAASQRHSRGVFSCRGQLGKGKFSSQQQREVLQRPPRSPSLSGTSEMAEVGRDLLLWSCGRTAGETGAVLRFQGQHLDYVR
ncbi:uncharacterized protein [Excalfactoria chinensis]|uniref:uncharacterized protein n=1 Tax=Excalfactoria chinensis TaxID=46218 RepID=UPI003B3B1589